MKERSKERNRAREEEEMGGGGGWKKGLTAMGMVVMTMMAVGEAQIDARCAQRLAPCLDYVESANPPQTCCGPIQDMVVNDLSCLCYVYTNTDFLQSLGLNLTVAVGLVRRCGLTVSFASCQASAPPPAETTVPQASPGAAGRVSFTTGTGLSFLLLCCAALLFL